MAIKTIKKTAAGKAAKPASGKYVYFFGDGKAEGQGLPKDVLGGKGQGLAEMTHIRLPVPAGFTIAIDACAAYYGQGKVFPAGMEDEVRANLKKLEKTTGKKFGDEHDPLLVSVRSGAARSMPGMMETILNLGLNDKSVEGFAQKTNNERFAYDSYRRFIQMYSTTAMGLSKEPMEAMLHDLKARLGVKTDPEIPAGALKELCEDFKGYYKKCMNGVEFPQDPMEQLWGAVKAVFGSWEAEKAVTYRRVERITDLKGTAVNVQQMVFGNKGDTSGTGVCFTRDPSTGENVFYGDCLINAQGEDVVAGIRTPFKLSELGQHLPAAWEQLQRVRKILETHYRDMQDLEFTVEEEKLYMLQCRVGKRTPAAAFRIAVEMVGEKLITRDEAVNRIAPEDIERLFFPVIAETDADKLKAAKFTSGIDAVPGAASGEAVFSAEDAEALVAQGHKVILVRKETSPEDVGGMHAAQGILTATGGKTSHAAVVARGWGKCCIVGAEKLQIDYAAKCMKVEGHPAVVKQGDWITLDGSAGNVYLGVLELKKPDMPKEYGILMDWCDQVRRINVRANADSPADAEVGIRMGAEGIGLCRTEHMFFEGRDRQLAIQEMIVAASVEQRKRALAKLMPFQRADFEGIFKAMDGKPVTIRLIDPPLHEFTPKSLEGYNQLAAIAGISPEQVRTRCEQLHESNPMLGHRGCRLMITYPEILDMQVTAIIEAAANMTLAGVKVLPEIMIPLTMAAKEFNLIEKRVRDVAGAVLAAKGVKTAYLVGTMIEIPRAALTADQIAEKAEFFSFGTNDLTQCCMGLSRDDAGRFLPDYVDEKKAAVFKADPFQSLDQDGVGRLVKIGIERGRMARPNLKIGICGEHGGERASVIFCHQAGMNYVSCSPFRVPIARLAAAQAAIIDKTAAKAAAAKAKAKAVRKAAAPVPAKKASAIAPLKPLSSRTKTLGRTIPLKKAAPAKAVKPLSVRKPLAAKKAAPVKAKLPLKKGNRR